MFICTFLRYFFALMSNPTILSVAESSFSDSTSARGFCLMMSSDSGVLMALSAIVFSVKRFCVLSMLSSTIGCEILNGPAWRTLFTTLSALSVADAMTRGNTRIDSFLFTFILVIISSFRKHRQGEEKDSATCRRFHHT